MFKFLFYCFLLYLLYRYLNPPALNAPPGNTFRTEGDPGATRTSKKQDDEGEYIDYEEIK